MLICDNSETLCNILYMIIWSILATLKAYVDFRPLNRVSTAPIKSPFPSAPVWDT